MHVEFVPNRDSPPTVPLRKSYRDGKKDCPSIVYGVMTDAEGRPIAVDVYPGNTADPVTVPDPVEKLRKRFGLGRGAPVGDREMLTDPVARAGPSASARRKKKERTPSDGFPVHRFDTLLAELGTLCRPRCRLAVPPRRTGVTAPSQTPPAPALTMTQETQPTSWQARVFELLGL